MVLHVEISEAGDVEHIDVLSGNPLLVPSTSYASVPSASTLITLPTGLMTGRLVHKVAPVYPALARANHIAGTVVLRAWVSMTGRIRNLIPVSVRAS